MDFYNIRPVTPEIQRQRGAKAFDDGVSIDGHNMNPDARAIGDWMRGWRLRQLETMRRPLTVQQLDRVSPP
jgi:hypothetical protein